MTQPVAPRALARLEAVAEVAWNTDPLRVLDRPELASAVRGSDVLFCLVQDTVVCPDDLGKLHTTMVGEPGH
ncbi:MAG: hypothetical protein HY615_08620 [Candidatus Rokubacteria bacterium]|nr:hypothetical protein [Candidatus Rokubacteria bacterium]